MLTAMDECLASYILTARLGGLGYIKENKGKVYCYNIMAFNNVIWLWLSMIYTLRKMGVKRVLCCPEYGTLALEP